MGGWRNASLPPAPSYISSRSMEVEARASRNTQLNCIRIQWAAAAGYSTLDPTAKTRAYFCSTAAICVIASRELSELGRMQCSVLLRVWIDGPCSYSRMLIRMLLSFHTSRRLYPAEACTCGADGYIKNTRLGFVFETT